MEERNDILGNRRCAAVSFGEVVAAVVERIEREEAADGVTATPEDHGNVVAILAFVGYFRGHLVAPRQLIEPVQDQATDSEDSPHDRPVAKGLIISAKHEAGGDQQSKNRCEEPSQGAHLTIPLMGDGTVTARRLPFARQGGGRDECWPFATQCAAQDAEGVGVRAEHGLRLHRDRLADHEVYDFTVELVCFGRGHFDEAGCSELRWRADTDQIQSDAISVVPVQPSSTNSRDCVEVTGFRFPTRPEGIAPTIDAQRQIANLPVIVAHAASPAKLSFDAATRTIGLP